MEVEQPRTGSQSGPLLLHNLGSPVVHAVHGGLEDADARERVGERADLIAISRSYLLAGPVHDLDRETVSALHEEAFNAATVGRA